MSHTASGRREPLNGNTPVPPPAGRSRLRAAGRALRRLSFGLGLICAAAAATHAQEAQTVKSAQTVPCDDKNYELRLVRAAAPVSAKGAEPTNAQALGVVLTLPGATESKAFFLYWLGRQ